MSVNWRVPIVAYMPTALTQLEALSVPATVDLREMESTVQVSPTVRIFFLFVSKNLMIYFFCFRY